MNIKAFVVGPKTIHDRILSNPRVQQGLFSAKLSLVDASVFGGFAGLGVWLGGTKIWAAPSVGEAVMRAAHGNIMEAATFGAGFVGGYLAIGFLKGALQKPQNVSPEILSDVEHIRAPKM